MPIIIIGLLVLILLVLIFGPLVTGLLALSAAIGAGVVATAMICLFGLAAGVYLLGGFGWCIWYLVDRRGAMEALRDAQRRQAK